MSTGVRDAATAFDALLAARDRGTVASGASDASPDALLALGDEVERRAVGDAGIAVTAGRALVELADCNGHARARARVRRALAQALAYGGDLAGALAATRDAAAIARAGGEAIEAARAELAALHPLAAMGRFDEAITLGLAVRDMFERAGETGLAGRADLNLGAVSAMRDDPTAALGFFERARPTFLDQPPILAQLDTNRGNALTALDDFDEADAAYANAAAAFQESGQTLAAAIAAGNRAYLATRQGTLQRALGHFESARRLLDGVAAPGHRDRVLAEQAEVLVHLGLPEAALALLDEIAGDVQTTVAPLDLARAAMVRARAAIALGQFETAGTALQTAARTFAEQDLPTDRARADILLAELALQSGDPDQARDRAQASVTALAERPADRATAEIVLARALLVAGTADAATHAVASALADAERLAITPLLAEAHLVDGRIRRHRGEDAVASFSLAVAETERIRGTLQAESLRSAFHGDRLAPYVELVRASLDHGTAADLATAFATIELAKSRALLDVVGRPPDDEANDDPLERELAARRAELNWRYSQFTTDEATRPTASGPSLRDLENAVQRLELRIAAAKPATHPSAPPVTLTETMSALAPDQAVLLYFALDDEVIAFTIRSDACVAHRGLTSLSEVQATIRRLNLQIARAFARTGDRSDRPSADANRELQRLHAMLVAPLQTGIGDAARLVVVPHGPLHTLPFAAFFDGVRALIDQYQIVTLPSVSLGIRLASTVPARPVVHAAVIGVADASARAIPDEVANVACALPGSKVLLGEAATAKRAAALASGADLVHFACHGRFDRAHPRASGLKLSDRWLTLDEIGRLDLAGAHATLSACDTGRAAVRAGDDLIGLTRAFYTAGVRSLVYTLWPVHDESTTELMTPLYREVRRGADFPAALRAAQLSLRAHRPHPAFWAPFAIGGSL